MTRKAMFPLMVLLVLVSIDAARASDQMPAPAAVISLEALAEQADLVALVQARDTDYIYRRNFPAGGSAFLHVLIPYKNARLDDVIEVYEHGMSEHGCYFPNPTVFEEGRRYLVFLREDKEKPGRFRGLATGCALDVLVAQDNSYAVRLPATGITLSDPLDGYREPFDFTDPYAVETDETINLAQRDELLAAGWIVARGDEYLYTSGVPLATVRQLMGRKGLAADR